MVFGVLERLFIVEQSPQRLVLRELPLLAWFFAVVMCVSAINLFILGIAWTAIVSLVGALVIISISRVRLIVVDRPQQTFQVVFRFPLRRVIVTHLPLEQVLGTHLLHSEDGNTQIILHTLNGDMGLSVYSKDMKDWKTPLVDTLNRYLADI